LNIAWNMRVITFIEIMMLNCIFQKMVFVQLNLPAPCPYNHSNKLTSDNKAPTRAWIPYTLK